jgi:hypothetical protein
LVSVSVVGVSAFPIESTELTVIVTPSAVNLPPLLKLRMKSSNVEVGLPLPRLIVPLVSPTCLPESVAWMNACPLPLATTSSVWVDEKLTL